MSQSKRTSFQQERRDLYQGDDKKDSSHYISAGERAKFGLPNKNDSLANYRMQDVNKNRSVHTTIDNHLLAQSSKQKFKGGSLKTASGIYIPERAIAWRIEQKIQVAKKQGDINNERFRNYLFKAAVAYEVDLRYFNGYSKSKNLKKK